MATTKKKISTYTVSAIAIVWTDVSVEATSLEEAVAKTNELKITDFVEILGACNDVKLHITGVNDSSALMKLN